MGNFSVNHYARIQVEPDGAKILFVLDLAEIPTFELMQKWGCDRRRAQRRNSRRRQLTEARDWMRQIHVTAGGKSVTPRFEAYRLCNCGWRRKLAGTADQHPFEGGRSAGQTRVFGRHVSGPDRRMERSRGGRARRSRDPVDHCRTERHQPGADGVSAGCDDCSSAGSESYGELGAEPVAVTEKIEPPPLQVASYGSRSATDVSRLLPPWPSPTSMGQVKRNDFLSRALKGGEIGWALGLTCLAVAFWFGALHALEPGHGKTMVAAYLVGARGTMKHAVFLGGMVTFTHTISVFCWVLVTLFLSQYIMPDKLSKVLGIISGLTIVYLGGMLLYRRTIGAGHGHHHHHHHHDEFADDDHGLAFAVPHSHDHHHDHSHHHHGHSHGGLTHTHDGHTHSHLPEGDVTFKSLMVLGASGGLVPCPSALVLLLSAISIGRTGFGMLLLLAFSLGFALVLMAMGLLVVYAKNLFPERKSDKPNLFFQYMPIVSAAIIFVIGIVLTGNSLGVIPVMRFFG